MKYYFWHLIVICMLIMVPSSQAANPEEIDINVDATIEVFSQKVNGGEEFLANAKGILVFPNVIKAGFIFGGEYGEGALRIKGKTVDYYRTTGASFGFQVGAQSKSIIIAFLDDDALLRFRQSAGWEAGVDGAIAIASTGAGGSIDTTNMSSPIVGFVFGNKGLMVDLSLKGSKYTRMNK
jgi:lipid-binding SYLF domain-containing protein